MAGSHSQGHLAYICVLQQKFQVLTWPFEQGALQDIHNMVTYKFLEVHDDD